jgi:hypothetical protein
MGVEMKIICNLVEKTKDKYGFECSSWVGEIEISEFSEGPIGILFRPTDKRYNGEFCFNVYYEGDSYKIIDNGIIVFDKTCGPTQQ